ncbi:MAG: CHRD domain-containing protein [Candidatus Krumholzibacteria bacterium]|nr:CHRD domain-containing protein [Candidatus Krumholzibacteria bacterium]
MRSSNGTALLALLLSTFFGLAGVARAEVCFVATIDGAQAGTPSAGTGTATFVLNDAGTELTYNIQFSGLGSAETAAHIHSAAEGDAVVKNLGTGSPKIGKWTNTDTPPLTAGRVTDLLNGEMYVNIHSVNFPGGEIRGQILQGVCSTTCFEASVDGAQAGTGSTGTGFGTFTLNHTETELSYEVTFSGLIAPETAAHIHSDAEGGGVVKNLGTGSPKVGVWSFTDTPPLNPARVTALKAGQHYVNIHSTAHPGGEIKGQMLSAGCTPSAAANPPAARTYLEQNHPNPFNPTTTIRFHVSHTQRVTLRVYEISGALVATLFDGVVEAGPGEVAWDGRDRAGRAVPSGVYFYRLATANEVEVRKMVLLK